MAPVAPFFAAYLVFVSLLLGSFINMAADRVPRGESVVRPRSHCRSCGRQLNVVDLLPVVGYMIRGGRCATCKAPIGVTAPIVETLAGACMAAPLLWFSVWPGALVGTALVAVFGVAVVMVAVRWQAPASAGGEDAAA